jgi:hypothetical protein
VVAIAASQWTNWCLCCWCVSAMGSLDEAPIVRLGSDWIPPGCGFCGDLTGRCGTGDDDENEKWKVLRNI